jgi:hypothetical protein
MAGQIEGIVGPAAAGPTGNSISPRPSHVLDRHLDRQVQLLAAPGLDHLDGAGDRRLFGIGRRDGSAQEPGHFVQRPLGGGKPDALKRPCCGIRALP